MGVVANVGAVHTLLLGMIAMACIMASMAFLRFWRVTADRFFGLFALSFALMAVNRVALAMLPQEHEARTAFYWLRLLAYLIILLAIVDKNRHARPAPGPEATEPPEPPQAP